MTSFQREWSGRRRNAPSQRVPVGVRGIDAPEPFDCPWVVIAGERQSDTTRDPGARRDTEADSLLHRRERLHCGLRVEARQAFESVHEDRLHFRWIPLEPDRADTPRALVNRAPRGSQAPIARLQKSLQVPGQPDTAAGHRKLGPLPGRRRRKPVRLVPDREHRIARLRPRLPGHPQPLRLRQRAGLVSGLQQCPGVVALQLDGGVLGIPLDELAPLALRGEPEQPRPSQPERHRLSVVVSQECLDVGPGNARPAGAQPCKLEVREQGIRAEVAPHPFPFAAAPGRRSLCLHEHGASRRMAGFGTHRGRHVSGQADHPQAHEHNQSTHRRFLPGRVGRHGAPEP